MLKLTLFQQQELLTKIAALRDTYFLAKLLPDLSDDQQSSVTKLRDLFAEQTQILIFNVISKLRYEIGQLAIQLSKKGLGQKAFNVAMKFSEDFLRYQMTAFKDQTETSLRIDSLSCSVTTFLSMRLHSITEAMDDEYRSLPKQTETDIKLYENSIAEFKKKFSAFELTLSDEQYVRLNKIQKEADALCQKEKIPTTFLMMSHLIATFEVNNTFQKNVFSIEEQHEFSNLFYKSPTKNDDDDESSLMAQSQSVDPKVITAINGLTHIKPVFNPMSLEDVVGCVSSRLFQQVNLFNCYKNSDDAFYRTYRTLVPISAAYKTMKTHLESLIAEPKQEMDKLYKQFTQPIYAFRAQFIAELNQIFATTMKLLEPIIKLNLDDCAHCLESFAGTIDSNLNYEKFLESLKLNLPKSVELFVKLINDTYAKLDEKTDEKRRSIDNLLEILNKKCANLAISPSVEELEQIQISQQTILVPYLPKKVAFERLKLFADRIDSFFQLTMRLNMPIDSAFECLKKATQFKLLENVVLNHEEARKLEIYLQSRIAALDAMEKFLTVIKQFTLQINFSNAAHDFISRIQSMLPVTSNSFLSRSTQSIDFLLGKLLTYFKSMVSSREGDAVINHAAVAEKIKSLVVEYKFNLQGIMSTKDPRQKLIVEMIKYYENEAKKIAPVLAVEGPKLN